MLTLLCALALHNAPAVKVERDVLYATIDGVDLKLDIAYPETPGPHPAAVGFHGGAWKYGSRREISVPNSAIFDFGGTGRLSLMEHLAQQGYVCASVEYRLAPKHQWPAPIIDAKTAIRFLRENAEKYHLDKDRVAAFGFSAGGHIAACLGTMDKDAGYEGELYPKQSSKVQCVVDYFGPADLTLYVATPGIESAYMKPFLGSKFADKPDVYKNASPVNFVDKNDPPFLMMHGTLDVVVPIIHSERLDAKLKAAGVDSTLVSVKGKGHGWEGDTAVTTRKQAIEFMDRQLKRK